MSNDDREHNLFNLWAPDSYWLATTDEIRKAIGRGGCGAGWFGDFLIPDTVWFLSIHPACKIHDWMYYHGRTLEDKNKADRVFLNNMLRLIDSQTKWSLLKWLRRRRAYTYYISVQIYGGPAYWRYKLDPDTMV